MKKVIEIDGKEIEFCASALTPRLYRHKFGRDMIADVRTLQTSLRNKDTERQFTVGELEIFENIAYIMAKQADGTVPDMDEWLDSFEMFSIYTVLP